MRLTILNVAYPFAHVGPDAVGGAEQVLSEVEKALVQAGHTSLVLACTGSKVAGKLFCAGSCSEPINDELRRKRWREYQAWIREICRRWNVDLVHYHGIDFYEYLPPDDVPALVTLHLPPEWYPEKVLKAPRPNTRFHCVSRSQMERCPPGTDLLPVIENGVSDFYRQRSFRKRNYAISLGRICPEKGFHLSADAARAAGLPLVIAGAVFPYESHLDYFEREIRPRLGAACRFVGPVGPSRKRRWLAGARCLVIPSLVAETSSLVAMEALACGTPVVAFATGALPNIVEHGKTGFIVHDTGGMAAAIQEAGRLSSEACRHAARTRFSLQRMTTCYLQCYQMLVERAQGTLKYFERRAKVNCQYVFSDR